MSKTLRGDETPNHYRGIIVMNLPTETVRASGKQTG
jgi:hypothetical protein